MKKRGNHVKGRGGSLVVSGVIGWLAVARDGVVESWRAWIMKSQQVY